MQVRTYIHTFLRKLIKGHKKNQRGLIIKLSGWRVGSTTTQHKGGILKLDTVVN